MIAGVLFRQKDSSICSSLIQKHSADKDLQTRVYHERLLLACGLADAAMGMAPLVPVSLHGDDLIVCWMGKIYNRAELAAEIGFEEGGDADADAELFLHLYERYGESCVEKINGKFSFVLYDALKDRFMLVRDRFGMESLYYSVQDEYIAFASTAMGVLRLTGQQKTLNPTAVGKFLLFNYNPGLESFFQGIVRLPAAHFLRLEKNGLSLKRYWQLEFQPAAADENQVVEDLQQHLRRAVSLRVDENAAPGIFLSGGMDSSTVVTLAAEKAQTQVNTFSYRCRAVSFDESEYARAMAEFTKSKHHEGEYGSEDVLSMPDIVRGMNEPFCDVGINIASFLLGKTAASSNSSYILTGDGGDELFAGHPVYEADKMARFVDYVPRPLLLPVLKIFSALPDSDQKKNLSVKLKRFAESLAYPKELLSHRWRIYYTAQELTELTRDGSALQMDWSELLTDILRTNRESNAPDLLSQCLYSDYQTAVDFYLRRNDLTRRLGIESRFPLLDHKLVEYCATMPSKLKIKGWFDTKYIFKKAMEGILPHNIIYRKDKLGHSIPMKNWIRDDKQVREMILDHVSPAVVAKRGLFDGKAIEKLTNDHLSKRRNNSHRLWALAVLEMWMRHFMDA
jgi:asparagine synthase (glutamine-hydrolysing)